MYKNDLIMMSTTNSVAIPVDSTIPLTTIERRRGCTFRNTVANNIVANNSGYYKVNGTITFSAPAAGNVTVSLRKNNVNVSGITGSETITTADTELRTITLSGIVRVFCNENNASFSLFLSGVAITLVNAELDFTYLG